MENNIKVNLKGRVCVLDLSDLRWVSAANPFQYETKVSGFMEDGEYLTT